MIEVQADNATIARIPVITALPPDSALLHGSWRTRDSTDFSQSWYVVGPVLDSGWG